MAPERGVWKTGEPGIVNDIDVESLREKVSEIAAHPGRGVAKFRATTAWTGGLKSRSTIEDWYLGSERIPQDYEVDMDEPLELLGEGSAPNPQMMLQAAINACILNTFVTAASVLGVELERVELESSGELDLRGFLGIDESVESGYKALDITVRVRGDGTAEQYEKMLELVQRQSPNYYNVTQPIPINLRLETG